MRVLVGGFGNVLRGDDAFGVRALHHLGMTPSPPEVLLYEVGIGGIHLVQELLDPWDALIIIDAVDVGRQPGTLLVIRPNVPDIIAMQPNEQRQYLAETHYATPSRALMLAGALGVLPATIWMVACQSGVVDDLCDTLSPPVDAAVGPAAAEVRRIIGELGVVWPSPAPASAGAIQSGDNDGRDLGKPA